MDAIKTLGDLRQAIEKLVEYNWADEEDDYKEHPCYGHIFHTLKALDTWTTEL